MSPFVVVVALLLGVFTAVNLTILGLWRRDKSRSDTRVPLGWGIAWLLAKGLLWGALYLVAILVLDRLLD
jgi:hypothetical protein